MKVMKLIATCDMTRAADGTTAEAAETLYLAFGTDAGRLKTVELDLSEPWARDLRDRLAPFLAAGHEPGFVAMPGEDVPAAGRANAPSLRAWHRALRTWAKEHGYHLNKLDKGGWYYPRKTKSAYRAHMEGKDAAWLAEHGLQPDFDPATGNAVQPGITMLPGKAG